MNPRLALKYIVTGLFVIAMAFLPMREIISEQAPAGTGAPGTSSDTIMLQKMVDKADFFAKSGKFDSAIMLFMQSGQMYAASNMKAKNAYCLNKVAEQLIMAGMFDQSIGLIMQALQLSREANDNKETGGCYINLGTIFAMQVNFDSAMFYYFKAEELWKNSKLENNLCMSELYANIASVYGEQDNLPKAFDYATKGISVTKNASGDSSDNLVYLYNIYGVLYQKSGDYPKAISQYEKAISLWEPKYGQRHPIIGALYANVGELYWEIGNNTQALFYLAKAQEVVIAAQGPGSPMLAPVYHNLACVYVFEKQYNLALPLLKEALRRWPLIGAQPSKIALTLNNIAYIYFKQNRYDSALFYSQQGINIARRISDQNPTLATLNSNLGVLFINTGRYQAARDTLFNAIRSYEERNIFKHLILARYYYNLGNLAFVENDFQQSLRFLQKSLICNVRDFNDTNVLSNPTIRNVGEKYGLLYALMSKSITLNNIYYRNPGQLSWLEKSFETAELATQLADSIRSEKTLEDSQWILNKDILPYPVAIEQAYILYHRTGNEVYLQKAFALSEKSKYNALLKSIRDLQARNIGGIPESLQNYERSVNSRITYFRANLHDEELSTLPDKNKIKKLQLELFTLSKTADSLKKALERNYPKYFRLKYSDQTASVREIQNKLRDDEAMVEYTLTNNYLLTFVITRHQVSMTGKPVMSELAKKIENFRDIILKKEITESGIAEYTASAGNLYSVLMAPVEPLIKGKALTIIPDGILGSVPFEALINPAAMNPEMKRYQSLPYLIKTYTIGYGYSATLFLNSMSMKGGMAYTRNIAGFAPSFPTGNNNWFKIVGMRDADYGSLKYARDEVKALETEYGGVIYLDSAATKSNFIQKAPGYNVLHISTHGIINDNQPLESMLVFYQPKLVPDSNLHVYELFNMKLNANLVVLSACNTGIGTLTDGEGMMSLSTGFAYAGVNSVVSTLWGVNDKSTADLMKKFYERLFNAEKKPEALRNARLDYLDEADQLFAHPFYWAGFIAIGNTQPIAGAGGFWRTSLILLALAGISIAVWMYMKEGNKA